MTAVDSPKPINPSPVKQQGGGVLRGLYGDNCKNMATTVLGFYRDDGVHIWGLYV